MPHYATISDIQARLRDARIEITDTSVPNTSEVNQIIEQTEGVVHAYLGNRYAIPITDEEAKKTLRDIVVAIVCERLFTIAYPQEETNPFADEAKSSRQLLRDLATGVAVLPSTRAPIVTLPSADFGEDTTKKHKIGERL